MNITDMPRPDGWTIEYDRSEDTYKLAHGSPCVWTVLSHDFAAELSQPRLAMLCDAILAAAMARPEGQRWGCYDVRPNALGGGYRVSRAKPGQVTPARSLWCKEADYDWTRHPSFGEVREIWPGVSIRIDPNMPPGTIRIERTEPPHVAPPVEPPPSPVDLPQIPGWHLSYDARTGNYILIHRASGVWTGFFVADPNAVTRPLVAEMCSALLDAAAPSSSGGHRLEGGCYDLIQDTGYPDDTRPRYTATRRPGVSR